MSGRGGGQVPLHGWQLGSLTIPLPMATSRLAPVACPARSEVVCGNNHVVSTRALFDSCLYVLEDILTCCRVKVTFVDGTNLDQW